jgi:hypothetical protein
MIQAKIKKIRNVCIIQSQHGFGRVQSQRSVGRVQSITVTVQSLMFSNVICFP